MENKELKEVKVKKETIADYIVMGIMTLLLLPLALILLVIKITVEDKCKHWRECPWYRKGDTICNKDGGMFYSYDKPGGCYYRMDDRKEELRKQNKRLRRLR